MPRNHTQRVLRTKQHDIFKASGPSLPLGKQYRFTNILSHSSVPVFSLPGIEHQIIAHRSQGTEKVEVWKQSLAPGAATPPHFHECEEVIYVLAGRGEITAEGQAMPFQADCTLILPAGKVHQITNTGAETIRLAALLSESPARVFLPSGERLMLPWDD